MVKMKRKSRSELRKGKTYEEIYGKDKSEIMKEMRSKQWKGFKRSESNKKNCSISKMGDLNPAERLEVRKKMSKSAFKRMENAEERYKSGNGHRGKHLSIDDKKKLSVALAGKTYEEIHGIEKAQQLKKHRSERMKGNKNFLVNGKPWNYRLTAKNDIRMLKSVKKMLKAVCSRPNKFEKRALAYLEILYPQRFRYTGNGTCIINGKSADAVDLENRTIALFNGVYWHLKRKGLEITEENKRLMEHIEAEPFNEVGYKVIFLWEDEI